MDKIYFDRQIKCIGLENTMKLLNYAVYTKSSLANKILKNCGVNISQKGEFKDIKIYDDSTVKLVGSAQNNSILPDEIIGSLIAQLVISELLFGINTIKLPFDISRSIALTLNSVKTIVVGSGGLGNFVSYVLNRRRVPFTIIDDDKIDKTNLARQILFTEDDVGKFKAEVLASKLKYCKRAILEKLKLENLNILDEYDVIYVCVDNFKDRYLITKYGLSKNKLVLNAGVEGQRGLILKNFDFEKYVGFHVNENSGNGIVPAIVALTGIIQAYMPVVTFSLVYLDFYTSHSVIL
ncbi:ThiF family adenylyltransferase [Thermosipho ferrireducens]|uniref:ThiF family adenylyltransferase n=1 Tax=Thermosipho ferrireducens TaxID=2571116 RepID=A0ABX7S992_9BACT|nr:ThiF family adenylyltransferase [Thermosipho ferrireducens]QTA37921.1 ThiF family adenylyltransferase [Thermosipho ferrireducens]